MRRLIPVLLIALVLIAVLVALYLWFTPRLLAVSPANGAVDVRVGSPLQLTFSGVMDTDSVIEHLVIDPPTAGTYERQDKTLVFTPDQPWMNGATIVVTLTRGAQLDWFVPLAMRKDDTWSFTVGQPRLAYLYPADGSPDIYTFNSLSGESQRLTEFGGIFDFDIYSTGNLIYFSQRSGRGGSRIYRIDLDGTEGAEPVLIIDCPDAICIQARVSPDGRYLAYERTALIGRDDPSYPQVWLLTLTDDQTSPKPDQATPKGTRVAGDLPQTMIPHWSPGGLLTYYDSSEQAFIVFDPEQGEVARFPNQTGQIGDWHPSGTSYVAPEIIFVGAESTGEEVSVDPLGSSHLILFQTNSGLVKDLTNLDTLEDTAPVFSPQGDQLAFARKYLTIVDWTPGRQLWLIAPDTLQARQLTDEPFYNHYNFAWSPSGDMLAFVRFNQTELIELPEIWIINLLTGNSTPIIEGGFAPQWIP